MIEFKTCAKCCVPKPLSDFHRSKRGKTKARSAYCKDCSRKSVRSWQKNNREKIRTQLKRADLKRLYGLTPESRDALIRAQNGLCAVCRKEIITKPHVDHCHKTGKIRGILCVKCNLLLGLMGDSTQLAYSAVDYLKYADTGHTVPSQPAKESRLLVTGASGLVGSALAAICQEDTIRLKGKADCDFLKWTNVEDAFSAHKPTHVIHLAAKVGGVKANLSAPATFFHENITLNSHVLEACRMFKVKKLVCFLSTCVFPDPCPLPLKPENLHAGPPHPSNYGYAYAKRMLAVQCAVYNQQYGTHFVPVIPCNIYGPNDNWNLENAHVVPALIRKFYEAKKKGDPVTIWGSGKPLREFIYSDDVARVLLHILEHYDDKTPLIVSTSTEHSIADLVVAIARATDFPEDRILFDTSKPEGQHRKPSDNGPLMKLLGPDWKFTPLEEGIEKTVRWFHDNAHTARL